MAQFAFEAIGTQWQIDIYEELERVREDALFARIMECIGGFDATYSRFRADSVVTKMSQQTGAYLLPPNAEAMLSLYKELYDLTGGFFTPLVGEMLSDAGYDAEYSLKQKKELSAPLSWGEVMDYEKPNLIIKKPALLDFGAAGKGYLVDLVAGVLKENGISSYTIDAGGDMVHAGAAPIRVGLEDPEHIDQVIGVCELKEGSICGSAGNRRKWGAYNHIMNPKTLSSATEIAAVWVTAPTAMLADALATCLFFVEPAIFFEKYDFEYAIVRSDRSIEASAHFPGEIFRA